MPVALKSPPLLDSQPTATPCGLLFSSYETFDYLHEILPLVCSACQRTDPLLPPRAASELVVAGRDIS
jgi:hypothetical protein